MLSKFFAVVSVLCLGALAAGCSGAREVEVTGQVSSASAQGEIVVLIFDVTGDEKANVHSVKAQADGSFKATLSLEGDEVLVRAIADADGDGACSAGEPWGEASGKIQDDEVEPLEITLGSAPCP